MRFSLEDIVSHQKLVMDFFPVTHATYQPPYTFLNGLGFETTKTILSQQGKSPDLIDDIISGATAVNPHMAVRLEGPLGRPISQVNGDLVQRQLGGRTELGFNMHMKSIGFEDRPMDPKVVDLEKIGVFVPLSATSLPRKNIVGALGRTVLTMGLKKEYQFRPQQKILSGGR
jgi:hypothetical protein